MARIHFAIHIAIFITFLGNSAAAGGEGREFLDDNHKILLSWSLASDNVTMNFELEAETTGWVGFGLSPSGSMAGADILIAGVYDNGTAYYSDRHATGFTTPIIDDHQDWSLLEARESLQGKTYLKFSRLLDTCDEEDYPIGEDTARLIWAMGESDTVAYHGATRRGTKSVNLLGAPVPDVDLDGVPQWRMTLDMEMPKDRTAYWCSFHRGPRLLEKHQIIAFDAFLPNAPALAHTHHFVLYNCYKNPHDDVPIEDILGNYTVEQGYLGSNCYEPWDGTGDIPPRYYCPEYLYVWAKGGKRMVFPENIGYPIGGGGEDGRESFYMIETHYDNPEGKEGLRFETGLTFYYTNKTREIDAGLLMIGHEVSPSITIPPNTQNFTIVGHCGAGCTSRKFPPDGITIFNALLHSHLSGRRLKLRHFRAGTELPWIDFDDHYDFDYQQNKQLRSGVALLPGDHVTYECTYDSRWKGGEAVIGGLSTQEEMCNSFLWYYPKLEDLDLCGSFYDTAKGLAELNITEFEAVTNVGLDKIWIKEPKWLEGDYQESMSKKFPWTEELVRELEDRRRWGMHEGLCLSSLDTEPPEEWTVAYPEIEKPYAPFDPCSS